MLDADLWAPLAPLGPQRAAAVERALGGAPVHEIEALLGDIERGGAPRGPLLAARFSLLQRGGASPSAVAAAGLDAQQTLEREGDPRGAAFLQIERAAVLLSDKALLPEAARLLDSVPSPQRDPALAAAIARVRGAIARARADLRGSLLHLEQARELATASGNTREIIRTFNTLGTSYAALGVASLARESLERARELAEIAGQRQSAAIAAGQLAVLALDAERPGLAVKHLELQRSVCERLDDIHGQARALSLLVEAHGGAHALDRAHDAAELCRALFARSPSPWTRLQAAMATLYEAELALAGGDEARAAELLRSCADERQSELPTFRVLRARSSIAALWTLLRNGCPHDELIPRLSSAFATLSRSPRPTWVEQALGLAIEICRLLRRDDLLQPLAVRRASLLELRASAASGALVSLRELAPDAAVGRAMMVGRELVLRARLLLGPLGPFDAWLIQVTTDGSPRAFDGALAAFEPPDRPGELPGDLLAHADGARMLRLACPDPEAARLAIARLESTPGVSSVSAGPARLGVASDPASLPALVPLG